MRGQGSDGAGRRYPDRAIRMVTANGRGRAAVFGVGLAALGALAFLMLYRLRVEPASTTVAPRAIGVPSAAVEAGPRLEPQPVDSGVNEKPPEATPATHATDAVEKQEDFEEARAVTFDPAFLRRWEEAQLMFPQSPFSKEWWRWRLGFEIQSAEEALKAIEGQEAVAERAKLTYARAIDRIAIACLLDCQGRFTSCENVESVSAKEGDKFVLHEYGRHYTYLPSEFPEWATLDQLRAAFDEKGEVSVEASDRLNAALQVARSRFAEALKAVGG